MPEIRYNQLPEKNTPSVPEDTILIIDSEDDGKVKRMSAEKFRGPEGRQGPVGPQGAKGDKGEPGERGEAFKYSDFTPEQLEALH